MGGLEVFKFSVLGYVQNHTGKKLGIKLIVEECVNMARIKLQI